MTLNKHIQDKLKDIVLYGITEHGDQVEVDLPKEIFEDIYEQGIQKGEENGVRGFVKFHLQRIKVDLESRRFNGLPENGVNRAWGDPMRESAQIYLQNIEKRDKKTVIRVERDRNGDKGE